MNAPIRNPADPPYELYRVILDYEALQDGFLDRIEDLQTTLEQIDMAGGFAKGNVQKLLTKNPGKAIARTRDHRTASARRTFGWESLGKMLKGTGLALALVLDDERFAPLKEQLAKRKKPRVERASSIQRENQNTPINIEELMKNALQARMREIGMKGNKSAKRRAKMMAKRARQAKATHAARKRWSKSG